MTNQSGRERRLKPRFSADVTCTVALTDAEHNMLFPNEKLHCRTRDVSESGLGLVANSIYLGYTCVVDEGRALLVTLELPEGPVAMEATAAHYVRLDAGARDATTYLIGLRVASMSDEARAAYRRYLEELSRQEQG
jgi:c-di-GMP-binding flagellar brake protein YcgR